MISVNKY